MRRTSLPPWNNMKKWNFRLSFAVSVAVLVLVIARLCVSIGRLVYSLYTGVNVVGGDVLPAWYELLIYDGFFYVGLLALAVCIVSAVKLRKKGT